MPVKAEIPFPATRMKYGRLTVISVPRGAPSRRGRQTARHSVTVECACGKVLTVKAVELMQGKVVSCGCARKAHVEESKRMFFDAKASAWRTFPAPARHRIALRNLVDEKGLKMVYAMLDTSEHVVMKVLAGAGISRGTFARLQQWFGE